MYIRNINIFLEKSEEIFSSHIICFVLENYCLTVMFTWYNSKVYTCHGCWFFLFWKMNTRKIKFISVDFILMFRSNYNWHISTDKIECIKVMLTLLPFLRELQTFILFCWFELYVCTVVFCFWIILLFKIFNGHRHSAFILYMCNNKRIFKEIKNLVIHICFFTGLIIVYEYRDAVFFPYTVKCFSVHL